jgi:hypothetical protein
MHFVWVRSGHRETKTACEVGLGLEVVCPAVPAGQGQRPRPNWLNLNHFDPELCALELWEGPPSSET